ncbi:MAG: hypothetical protein P8099_20890, partial [Gemmatimonadota bacterium]
MLGAAANEPVGLGRRAKPAPRRATVRDYLVLTKPRFISLLLLTTVGAMFIAARGFPGWLALVGVMGAHSLSVR